MNLARQQKAKRALRRFWVAGTAGAFLSALSRNLPLDIESTTWSPEWPYTFDLFIRYGYMLWLLAYFFISSFSTEEDEVHLGKDIAYDILQSIFALGAVFCLGYVVRGAPDSWLIRYAAPNIALLFMSVLALKLFYDDKTPRIQSLRCYAAITSGIAILFTLICKWSVSTPSMPVLLTFCVLQLILWWLLACFFKIRWSSGPKYERALTSSKLVAPPVVLLAESADGDQQMPPREKP
ncbi:MAG TPA: hypothetical protein VHB47_21150 [Thermoanaerobaculia bacterium]|jgi:hypothetical protein|nr:hypothetical protein [Thermoanaerobaculia bacterium]